MTQTKQLYCQDDRKAWIELLATSDKDALEQMRSQIPENLKYNYIVRPETGMIMIQARADGTASRFNFGEATVTKCVLEVAGSHLGYAMVMGSDPQHAELAALFDGLLQHPTYHETIKTKLLKNLTVKNAATEQRRMKDIQDTTVEFFTLKRGE